VEPSHCTSCGAAYIPDGKVLYCSNCGAPLKSRKSKTNLVDDIRTIDDEPTPYEALRFTGGLIVFIGWVVIIMGWFFAFTLGLIISETIARNFISDGEPYSAVRNMTMFLSVIMGMGNSLYGLLLIASGQVVQVLLDMRNDTHATRRYVRRFGLNMSENAEKVISAD